MAALAIAASGCGIISIGQTVQGRDITIQSFGSGDRVVLLIGGLHTGPEDNTRLLAEQVAAYLRDHPEAVPDDLTVVVLPSANPDGTANGTHTNANGVDLNRNWPSADWVPDACHPTTGCRVQLGGPHSLSEPETIALYNLVQELRPEITIVWHAEAPLVEANEVDGADVYARAYAAAAGYEYVEEWEAYDITGELIDGLEQGLRLRAFDVELAECCTLSPEEFARNMNGVLALLAAVEQGLAEPHPTQVPKPTPTPFELDLDGL
jgi:predicted deacylase